MFLNSRLIKILSISLVIYMFYRAHERGDAISLTTSRLNAGESGAINVEFNHKKNNADFTFAEKVVYFFFKNKVEEIREADTKMRNEEIAQTEHKARIQLREDRASAAVQNVENHEEKVYSRQALCASFVVNFQNQSSICSLKISGREGKYEYSCAQLDYDICKKIQDAFIGKAIGTHIAIKLTQKEAKRVGAEIINASMISFEDE